MVQDPSRLDLPSLRVRLVIALVDRSVSPAVPSPHALFVAIDAYHVLFVNERARRGSGYGCCEHQGLF